MSEKPEVSELRESQFETIEDLAQTCAKSFNLDFEVNSVEEIVTFIHEMVGEFQSMGMIGEHAWKNISSPMGALWGKSLIKEFNWQWIEVQCDEASVVKVALVNEKHSIILYPFNYIQECLDLNQKSKILLLHNKMTQDAGFLSDLEDNSYTDIMARLFKVLDLE